jgi:hypothetical protein
MNNVMIKNHLYDVVSNWKQRYLFGIKQDIYKIHTREYSKNELDDIDIQNPSVSDETELTLYHLYLEHKKLLENSIIVSGGCITSMFLNEEVHDYDIYFTNNDIVNYIIQYYLHVFNKHNNTDYKWSSEFKFIYKQRDNIDFDSDNFLNCIEIIDACSAKNINPEASDYIPICITPNAISLTHGIQLITRFTGQPEKILSNFDFIHTNNYYLYGTNQLVTNHKAIESILTRQLIYNGSKYPICSMIRTRKFIKRGWNISAGEYLKMAFQIQDLDLYNISVLREQLIGVDAKYFIKFLDILKTKNSLNVNEIFDLLNNIFEEVGDE